ncbi:tRNA (N6-isopentenyl adenosine(37)-C2)-methylthiotransferase MiaB [Rathayibacter toxicus]|uniref:tRNA-2-methylthio-N(6)-dimethylallyladenosine synthase n=1 Tax=Rathayibacter toxicus TaxID=145458 RepID=A0A0C5BDT2_9MICO|nr:tRNA (N6-isopentenyl adenosine(37)-C2)-methylthiotransferase MiaB [Rathayibacter toxicus]AJM77406.1 (dimethylallyl)adenosine tRNA methylthiotransferase [Rathayibacter toxicus]ALS56697.1 tRNA-2-methylthio-N(6)-dimethylallyladenosine synthase MiaB [Rathayibacter toxicus]KKM45821.1 (dimethylallyl)adenosine tRNA methylthiotransferase [Rathayibacter toxicus]PPG22313.1 tRNA (N6-isopentenyl adenosine(37)-C2)-methylthiotransferase MiaB [Rathayibacter toxicus]PPG47148.1 tRNA (N6-isopentenyl adenosin
MSKPGPVPLPTVSSRPRTYEVRTFGCQMNVHDSERLSGSLEAAGYVPADGIEPDVVVINTCAVRENADNKLYGNLGYLASVKRRHRGMQIAVGGCLAQKDKNVILDRAPWVDVVFGTHNMGAVPRLLERARHNQEAQLEILESLEVFPSTLPTKRDSTYSGWVSISVGCNNTCTFCIVPSLRGKEKDRRPGDILAEIQALVDDGVIEVTLLGQNVNSYGVEFGDRYAFSKLLRTAGSLEGLERLRFTSPHPAAFTDDVIDAMAETPAVMPQLHMPLQSGSDRILRAMRRSYRSEKFLGILDRVRARVPHAAITTDIIVGFPGETEEDFAETLRVVEEACFASAFTFQYSIRPGTPAATLPSQIPKAVVQERYERLVALQDAISERENLALVGREVEVLVATNEGRRDSQTQRLSGRAEDNRLVHFDVPTGSARPRPGDVVSVVVTKAAPFYLIADSMNAAPLRIRPTRAGDAWDRSQAQSCGTTSDSQRVALGLPSLRVSATTKTTPSRP